MLYLAIIFISAFLLFQVQPLIAKLILPYFGGGAAVWTACLLFFQAFLLLGYFYAHCLTQIKSVKKQLGIHFFLIICSIIFLPIGIRTWAGFSASISITEYFTVTFSFNRFTLFYIIVNRSINTKMVNIY